MERQLARNNRSNRTHETHLGAFRALARTFVLLALAALVTACGTAIDESVEPQARVAFVVRADDTAAWTPLDGATLDGQVQIGLDTRGDAGQVLVEVAGASYELQPGAYQLDLDTATLEPGAYDAVASVYIAGGRKTKESARAWFDVVAPEVPTDDGTTDDGTTDDGTTDDGTTDDGTTDDGTTDDGATDDGTTDDGTTDDGTADDGTTDDGTTDDGTTDDGATDDGATDDGTTDDGATDDGATDDGTTDDGTTDDGTTDDGATDDGTTDDGTTDDGTTDDPEAFDAPIVITEGGTYSGRWESLDSSVPAVTIDTSEPVVLQDSTLRGAGHLISASWSDADLTVRNVAGEALYPTEVGRTPGRFLHAEGYARIVVENSAMTGTSGIYLNASHRGATVRIVANRVDDIDGREADGAGGWDGATFVQFVQLNDGDGLVDSVIAWNLIENTPYESRVEDVVSLYKTTGTAGDPIVVRDNFIRGAYPADPATSGYSGGGIMLGDGGGAYQLATNNTVVATSNYGVAISGGHDNRIENNTIVSCGLLPDGTPIASQNVGAYVWNMHDDPAFGSNAGTGNVVAWAHHDHGRNDWWTPDATEWSGNTHFLGGDDVSCTVEEDAYAAWLNDAETMQANVGLID